MIVFVDERDAEECREKYNKRRYKHMAISFEMLDSDLIHGLVDGSWVLPPPKVQNEFINNGDLSKYIQDYYDYLNSPMVLFNTTFELINSNGLINDVTFVYYSNAERELLYPKLFRKFLTNKINIPKKYILKYINFDGDFKVFDKKTDLRLWELFMETKSKTKELMDIVN